ncbi:MAG: N-acetyltransferase [Planctomycetaceae bacterium]
MARVVVRPVETRSERKRFVRLAWRIYREDPHWVPPILHEQDERLGFRPHPFYKRARAKSFLVTRGAVDVGRITAIVNDAHNERHGESRGFFGFFECEDDSEAARALFEAARGWLHDQGMTCVRGPMNPSQNYECGLLVDGFDSSPMFMMTYNPRWYERLIQENGFVKAQDLYAFWGETPMLETIDRKIVDMAKEIRERLEVDVRTLDTKRFEEGVRVYFEVYNASLTTTWGFVPFSEQEIRHLSRGLKWLIDPKLAIVAEVKGRPIGTTFCLLDYNPRIREIGGRLFPFGFLKLLWNRRAIKNMRVVTANVTPEYQAWGVGLVLVSSLVPRVLEWGIREAEFSWVLESNHLSRKTLERGGAIRYKTYRVYQDDPPTT